MWTLITALLGIVSAVVGCLLATGVQPAPSALSWVAWSFTALTLAAVAAMR